MFRQLAAGPHLAALTRRLWALLLASFIAVLAGLSTGFLVADAKGYALAAVGVSLLVYGLLGKGVLMPKGYFRRRPHLFSLPRAGIDFLWWART